MKSLKSFCVLITLTVLLGFSTGSSGELAGCPELASGSHIRPENRYYDVSPRIVPSDSEVTIEIIPKFAHVQFKEDAAYELTYTPLEQIAAKSGWTQEKGARMPVKVVDGRIRFTQFFEGEQQHSLYLEEVKDNKRKVLGDFRVYSLEKDLLALRPFKGDIHMHSNRSDGVESPAYVAGACRRVGLDFMALSDHRAYEGSQEAQKAFEDAPIDLRIYNGEEVHTPGNTVHIVSFGATHSITKQFADEAQYRAAVQDIMSSLPQLPDGVDRFQYAACVWAFQKIRDAGGMGMFCHSYWFMSHHYSPGSPLTGALLDLQPFDMFELISGFDHAALDESDTSNLQVARYNEERAKGKRIPICGISDTHGVERSETFGRNYTICFAPSSDLPDLMASIRNLNSVAVEAVRGDLPRAYGPMRLVKYTAFLLREVLPQHDELCFEEGRLMIQYASGEKGTHKQLKKLKGQTAALYAGYWGVPAKKK